MTLRRLASFFFLATVFCCTFEKVHWSFGGAVSLADVLAICFLVAYAVLTRPRLPRTSVILLSFFAAFVLVYLIGFYNLETSDALSQFAKGFVKFLIHFAFLAVAALLTNYHLANRSRFLHSWVAVAWVLAGVGAIVGAVGGCAVGYFTTDGNTYTVRDPYAFLPTLGELDIHLVMEGRHEDLYTRLGAHVREIDGVTGTSFAVWAPNARSVAVVGDFNSWDGRLHPMRSLGPSGIWELFIPDIGDDTKYKFEIRTKDNRLRIKADPVAFYERLAGRRTGLAPDPG